MIVLRILGWALVLAALGVVGRELFAWYATGTWTAIPVGQIWFEVHRESLLLAQPAIERYLWPGLWTAIAVLLQWPAWAVLGAPGLGLLLGAWWARRRRRHRG